MTDYRGKKKDILSTTNNNGDPHAIITVYGFNSSEAIIYCSWHCSTRTGETTKHKRPAWNLSYTAVGIERGHRCPHSFYSKIFKWKQGFVTQLMTSPSRRLEEARLWCMHVPTLYLHACLLVLSAWILLSRLRILMTGSLLKLVWRDLCNLHQELV